MVVLLHCHSGSNRRTFLFQVKFNVTLSIDATWVWGKWTAHAILSPA